MSERDVFEIWAIKNIGGVSRKHEPGYTDEYESVGTQIAWKAWQAATKLERSSCAMICESICKDDNKYAEDECTGAALAAALIRNQ